MRAGRVGFVKGYHRPEADRSASPRSVAGGAGLAHARRRHRRERPCAGRLEAPVVRSPCRSDATDYKPAGPEPERATEWRVNGRGPARPCRLACLARSPSPSTRTWNILPPSVGVKELLGVEAPAHPSGRLQDGRGSSSSERPAGIPFWIRKRSWVVRPADGQPQPRGPRPRPANQFTLGPSRCCSADAGQMSLCERRGGDTPWRPARAATGSDSSSALHPRSPPSTRNPPTRVHPGAPSSAPGRKGRPRPLAVFRGAATVAVARRADFSPGSVSVSTNRPCGVDVHRPLREAPTAAGARV